MANILITNPNCIHHYTPIASIKQYNEPDFEKKLFRYGKDIFQNYHVFNFEFPLSCDELPGLSFKPDLLLVSKTFKKWVLVEVELCKTPTQHSLDQITCFKNPKINAKEVLGFIIRQDKNYKAIQKQLLNCFLNYSPDLIVLLDDYSDEVFNKFYKHYKQLKICVLEVYKRSGYTYEGYRFGGNYPYEITNSTKLEYYDEQHYKVAKKDFLKDLPDTFVVKFEMQPYNASLIKMNQKSTYLKLPDHNIPSDIYLQLGISTAGEYVIQKL